MYHKFARLYDSLMQLDYREYLAVWTELTSFSGKDVLEWGCGTGNVTKLLIPQVNSIDATDSSEDMLMLAQQKIQSPKCRFFLAQEDIFASSKRYDRIGLFVDVVNYLSHDEFAELLSQWEKLLKPDGEILFDVSNEDKLANTLGQQIYRFEHDGSEVFWVNEYDDDEKVLDFSLIIYEPQGNAFTRSEEFHTQYVYTPDDVTRIAKSFDITARHHSDRSFYQLRKKHL